MELVDIIYETENLLKTVEHKEDLYGIFFIPKKHGYRKISAPSRDLKYLQKKFQELINRKILYRTKRKKIKSHLHGFIKNRSIITNAHEHLSTLTSLSNPDKRYQEKYDLNTRVAIAKNRKFIRPTYTVVDKKKVLVKLDIKNAFNNVKTYHVKSLIKSIIDVFLKTDTCFIRHYRKLCYSVEYKEKCIDILTELVTLNGSIPQGAPTSPLLLNMALSGFEKNLDIKFHSIHALSKIVNLHDLYSVNFSIYADDISISFSLAKTGFVNKHKIASLVEYELKKYGFKLNLKKTRLYTIKNGFKITGMTLTNQGLTVSREYISLLRSKINNYIKDYQTIGKENELLINEFQKIQGSISYIGTIDISKHNKVISYFINRVKKYQKYYGLNESIFTVLKNQVEKVRKIKDIDEYVYRNLLVNSNSKGNLNYLKF